MKINPKIFKEYDIRGRYPEELGEAEALALGVAFAKLSKAKKIVIGRDARPESEKVFWPLVEGLSRSGMKIYDLGVCATPELFFAVGKKKFPAGVMVTASHSPLGETGFKFCNGRGVVYGLKTGLKKLAKMAEKEIINLPLACLSGRQAPSFVRRGKKPKIDFISVATEYKKFVLSFTKPKALKDFNIVLDASGGSGSRLAEVVFRTLPVRTTLMNFRAGDEFPDHGPNPLIKGNEESLSAEVIRKQADLGIIFDGDADRAVFFDENGVFVEPYHLNCLLAEIILKRYPGLTVVIDARLNLALSQTIKSQGGKVLSHRSGYANFIKTMSERNLQFGCENSGHFIFNFSLKNQPSFVYGDAIIPILLVLKYLSEAKLSLSQAVSSWRQKYPISGELNYPNKDFSRLAARLKKIYSGLKQSEIDGLSVWGLNGQWFFNVRPSQNEPLIRLNIEATSKSKLTELKKDIIKLIK